jgi:acetylornithine/succinyldiaminopimelate/putrescine aminotransferase
VSCYLGAGLAVLGVVGGLGLLRGVELPRPAAPIVEAALANGLVIGSAGEHILRLTPPLTLSLDEAALALVLLEGALA